MGVREARAVHAQLGRLRVHGLHERRLAGVRRRRPAPSRQDRGAPAACATALAASLPEAVSTALSASPNDISSPAASPALDSPTAAASGVTTMRRRASRCSAATIGRHDLRERGDLRPLVGRPAVPERALLVHERRMRCVDVGKPVGGKARSAALRRSTMSSSSTEPKAAASGRHARRPTRVRQAAARRWRRRAFIGCSSGACGGFVCVTVYALESVAWEAA